MTTKGQKEAVVEAVRKALPNLIVYQDIALIQLTNSALENLKYEIGQDILSGKIEYSKPLIRHEVMAYARSMVMNHLKKAKELNGNQIYGVGPAMTQAKSKASAIDMESLPDDLRSFVESLV